MEIEQVFCRYCRAKLGAIEQDRNLDYHAECIRLVRGDIIEDDFIVLVALEEILQKQFIKFTDSSHKSPGYEVEEGRIVSIIIDREPLGTFPEVITELDQLRFLSIIQIKIEMLPESIGKLRNLENLDLSHNPLKFLPEAITELVNLKYLTLFLNRLERLPESFGNLLNLENLDIARNLLESLPESMANLQNLKQLLMGYNKFETLPEIIGNLSNLVLTGFANTKFTT